MARIRKYLPGRPIKTIAHLAREIEARRYMFWNARPVHPGWIGGMQFNALTGAMRRGILREARENPEYVFRDVGQ